MQKPVFPANQPLRRIVYTKLALRENPTAPGFMGFLWKVGSRFRAPATGGRARPAGNADRGFQGIHGRRRAARETRRPALPSALLAGTLGHQACAGSPLRGRAGL